MVQDVPDVSAVRNERDDAHLPATQRTTRGCLRAGVEAAAWPPYAGPPLGGPDSFWLEMKAEDLTPEYRCMVEEALAGLRAVQQRRQ